MKASPTAGTNLPTIFALLCGAFLSIAASASAADYHPPRHLPANAFTVPEADLAKITLKDRSIPKAYWGRPLLALHPVRVHWDRVNIAVVTKQSAHEERGVYFYVTVSSYLPVEEPGRHFEWNEKTRLLEFVFAK